MRRPTLAVSRVVFALLLAIGFLAAAPGLAARGISEDDEETERASQHSEEEEPAGEVAELERQAEDAPPEEGPPEPDPDVDPADGVDPDPEIDLEIEPEIDPDAEPEVEPDIVDPDDPDPDDPDPDDPDPDDPDPDDPDPDDPDPVDEDPAPDIDVEQLMLELERAPIVFDRPADARTLAVRIEADRRLLSELRKPIPTSRIEAELYLRRIRDLAAISDPVSLVPLANNVIRQAPLLFEWMETEYDDPEARARDYYVGGSWAFHRRFDAFHRAVLLTVIRRLDTVGDLLQQGDQ